MQKKNHFFSIVWLDKYVDKRSISCLLSSNHFVIRPDIDVRSAQVSLLIRKEVPKVGWSMNPYLYWQDGRPRCAEVISGRPWIPAGFFHNPAADDGGPGFFYLSSQSWGIGLWWEHFLYPWHSGPMHLFPQSGNSIFYWSFHSSIV